MAVDDVDTSYQMDTLTRSILSDRSAELNEMEPPSGHPHRFDGLWDQAVYVLRDPRTQAVRYVGKSAAPYRRLSQHVSEARWTRQPNRRQAWIKGLLAAGLEPEVEVLAWYRPDEIDAAEIFWIASFGELTNSRLTNGTAGGEGGAITDPEALGRIRAAHVGRKASAETRARMSTTQSAVQGTPEMRAAASERSLARGAKPPVRSGEANNKTKLSDVQVRELRERSAAGEAPKVLAEDYGVTTALVSWLVAGKGRLEAGGPIREVRPRTRLTDADVAEIRRLAGMGVKQADLARRYGVDPSHICKTVSGQRR